MEQKEEVPVVARMTPEEEGPRAGERIVFWAWSAVLAAGLIVMIVIPLGEM
ncbi:MAG: hypothetical protein NT132_03785 [Microbacterium sp.]|uniref:hypothetical protein n=1 Tax=Microbacterium sp. TaxID=51671 RepID=UPI00262941FC|nr:hypothetical protein [Microbacterium sp.]MCX6501519.1 hypothetical protein [Microbacterium sp.]